MKFSAFAFTLLFAGAFAAPNPAEKLEARMNCAQCIAVYSASSCTAPGAVENGCGSLAKNLDSAPKGSLANRYGFMDIGQIRRYDGDQRQLGFDGY
ncbi:hypothetical protein BDV24DRAFT_162409 [Aspergillus arachidicola]|uniref:Uncharacterized protein n=1 Tax=Aspergillus arachidicola TaxID=656916 RepID=A0A2G7FV23_9EURO|nr:hypothetical protein BDV24DRAFT_162409 [Aspergillus arachidicola]PIG84452.1 hypothetical protein AARAC_002322 [Aspergillus arachidicola]